MSRSVPPPPPIEPEPEGTNVPEELSKLDDSPSAILIRWLVAENQKLEKRLRTLELWRQSRH